MHVQVINFNLEGINRTEYEAVCDELAGAFAELPGLFPNTGLPMRKTTRMGAFTSGNQRMPIKRI
jgi:hypothetical protein